ncbi:MAG: hypothetical protein ABI758_02005 [Candidatus Woesebacteria bacterium]
MDIFENNSLLLKDKKNLEQTPIPVVTVAASFRDELARYHGVKEYFGDVEDEVLFSRAHYSMALAALVCAWGGIKPDPKKAWGVDPTNYVTRQDWGKLEFTEEVGQLMARNSFLKWVKDLIDTKVRQKLPITGAIATPLLMLFERVHRPILSFHYETGNLLIGAGKQVVQVVTDPHVRPQYLEHAERPTIRYCVFDEKTRTDMLELAEVMGKDLDPKRVVVTGPPVDPRIVAARKKKSPTAYTKRPVRLVITTGGLGTNKKEIETCFRSLAPLLRHAKIQLIVYVGVHEDIREMIHQIAKQEGIPTAEKHHVEAPLRIFHSPHIVQANEMLIQYAFPWADGFITKPSGDMAYDAAAAGCFLLTLEPWGEWEHNIRDIFEQRGISRRAIPEKLQEQLDSLLTAHGSPAWAETAIGNALALPKLFTEGIQNILDQMPTS